MGKMIYVWGGIKNILNQLREEKEFSLGIQLVLIILAVFSLKPTSKTTSGILQLQSDLTLQSLKIILNTQAVKS